MFEFFRNGHRYKFIHSKCLRGFDHIVRVHAFEQELEITFVTQKELTEFIKHQELLNILLEVIPLIQQLSGEDWYNAEGCKLCEALHNYPDEPNLTSHKYGCTYLKAYHINNLIKEYQNG